MATKPIEILIRAKDEASSVFNSLKSNAAAVGAAIAGYFGFTAFVGAVKGAADLEAALSQVKAVSGASAEEMVKLRAAAEAAGRDTQYTATQAATALGNLARSGMTATQAIEAMPATLRLAAAGGIELEQSSTIVTRTLAGFVLQAGEAARVADVLALGANASNTSVQGLGEALSYAAPIAKSVGLSLEGTVAIIGKFADAGIDASRAGTALNAILGQFADPASKFKTELSNLGITTGNFETALNQLAAAGGKGEKAILAVGTEAGPALRGLLNQGIGALNELKTKLSDAGGGAEATAKVMQDNLNGSIKGLGSAWDTLKNALATPVLPVLKDGVDKLAESFKTAVDGGLIARFGDAIAKGFEAAITWARAFAAQVDFAALATTVKGYAAEVGTAFNDIKNAATTAGDIVRLVWGTMSAGANAVMVAATGVGAAFTSMLELIQRGLAVTMEGFAKVTFGGVAASFREAAVDMKLSADATGAATAALEAKAKAAFDGMAAGAQTARNGWAGLTVTATESTPQINTASAAIANTATNLAAMGDAATAAATKAKASSADQVAAAEATKAKVAELRAEYEAAVATGNWQLAVEKLRELDAAAKGATTSTAALADKAAAIADAFSQMGIKTQAELQTLADTSKTRFDLIKTSGQATAEGLAIAFRKAAQDAIDANNGVAPSWVKAQAAAAGYKVVVDELGQSTLVKVKTATDDLNGSLGNNAAAYSAAAAAAREWAEAQTTAGAAARAAKLSAAELEADLSGDKYGNRPGGLPARNAALSEDYKRRKAAGQDADGNSVNPLTGKKYEASGTSTADMLQKLAALGYDIKDPAAQRAASRVSKNVTDKFNNYTGIGFSGGGSTKTVEQLLQEAMGGETLGVVRANQPERPKTATPGAGPAKATAPATSAASPAPTTAAKTYNVTFNGKTAKAVSDADAQALMAMLQDAQRSA